VTSPILPSVSSNSYLCSGAYCATVIIKLLCLPVELLPDSPGWSDSNRTLLSGLPDWIRTCKLCTQFPHAPQLAISQTAKDVQARRTRAAYPANRTSKLMARMRSVLLDALLCLVLPQTCFHGD
jgi:hypothetical protein